MDFSLFDSILVILLVAIATTAVFRRLRIPSIVGYIVVGVIVGPYALGWIPNVQDTRDVAEFGIVFLMFTIGLEFSFARLFLMKRVVFGYGGLQVLLSILVTILLSKLLGMSLSEAMIIGSIVAMSSTAIVVKQLKEQFELHSKHGSDALGILLFQDLAVIPLLILIPSLVDISAQSFFFDISLATTKGFIAIFLMLGIGHWILRPLFYEIASARALELFTLATLFVTLGAAWLTNKFGLSLALGAFLAGIMLGETEFRHQIEVSIRPFRDVLLGLFFISIGMELNLITVTQFWFLMFLLLACLLLFKAILIMGLGLLFGNDKATSLRTGIMLAQGGEFGFAILSLALSYQLLPQQYGQVILGAMLLSMAIAPLAIRYNRFFAEKLFPLEIKRARRKFKREMSTAVKQLRDHVVICGYGRVGQNIARFLEKVNIPFVALDLDPSRVSKARLAGDNVCYGDASNYEMLTTAKIKAAKAIVISFRDSHAAAEIIQQIRNAGEKLPIVVRTDDESETNYFYELGATEVIPETLEASLMLASNVLLLMKVPVKKVYHLMDESRGNRYDLLRKVFPGEEFFDVSEQEQWKEVLYPITLTKGAFAIGKKLQEINLDTENVQVVTLRRGNKRNIEPELNTLLEEGDVLVLYGLLPYLEKAEKVFLEGGLV